MTDENESDGIPRVVVSADADYKDVVRATEEVIKELGEDPDPEIIRKLRAGVAVIDENSPMPDGSNNAPQPSKLPKSVYDIDRPKGKGR